MLKFYDLPHSVELKGVFPIYNNYPNDTDVQRLERDSIFNVVPVNDDSNRVLNRTQLVNYKNNLVHYCTHNNLYVFRIPNNIPYNLTYIRRDEQNNCILDQQEATYNITNDYGIVKLITPLRNYYQQTTLSFQYIFPPDYSPAEFQLGYKLNYQYINKIVKLITIAYPFPLVQMIPESAYKILLLAAGVVGQFSYSELVDIHDKDNFLNFLAFYDPDLTNKFSAVHRDTMSFVNHEVYGANIQSILIAAISIYQSDFMKILDRVPLDMRGFVNQVCDLFFIRDDKDFESIIQNMPDILQKFTTLLIDPPPIAGPLAKIIDNFKTNDVVNYLVGLINKDNGLMIYDLNCLYPTKEENLYQYRFQIQRKKINNDLTQVDNTIKQNQFNRQDPNSHQISRLYSDQIDFIVQTNLQLMPDFKIYQTTIGAGQPNLFTTGDTQDQVTINKIQILNSRMMQQYFINQNAPQSRAFFRPNIYSLNYYLNNQINNAQMLLFFHYPIRLSNDNHVQLTYTMPIVF